MRERVNFALVGKPTWSQVRTTIGRDTRVGIIKVNMNVAPANAGRFGLGHLGLIFAVLLWATPAAAWNRGGHLVTGALVYDELVKADAQLVAQTVVILKEHPSFSKWERDLDDAPAIDRSKALLMLAAAFPDDARIGQFKRYDRPNWHYVNFAYTPGQPLVDVQQTAPFNGKLLEALASNLATYKDTTASPADRAVALSWVLHLAADLTQPLHVTALVTEDLPDGDRGGNRVYVRGSERAKNSVTLHKLWDDGATGVGVKLAQAGNVATRLRREQPASAPLRGAITDLIRSEASSSYRIAVEHVYLNGALKYVTSDDLDAPVLPTGYTKRLKELSDQQMLKAAGLIAALLR